MKRLLTLVLRAVAALCVLVPFANTPARANDAPMSEAIWFYLGTYTGPKSKGIYLVRLDSATGKLDQPALVIEEKNASFLALHPTRPFLYAVCELQGGGSVVAYEIDSVSRTLKRLNSQPSGGNGPCFVSVDGTGRCVMTANYSSAEVASFCIKGDGSVGEKVSGDKHEGTGPIASRQQHAFAHSILPDPSNRYAISCDLGADSLYVYKLNPQAGTLTAGDPPFHKLSPGDGPRHIAFSPDGDHAYVVNELGNSVTTLAWDDDLGRLKTLQTLPTMEKTPETYTEEEKAAEILVHPTGKYVYASNRGEDTIVIYGVQPDHTLKTLGRISTDGKGPRSFGIDPTGRFLVAANERSDSLTAYSIDIDTGLLKTTSHHHGIGRPVCVRFCK